MTFAPCSRKARLTARPNAPVPPATRTTLFENWTLITTSAIVNVSRNKQSLIDVLQAVAVLIKFFSLTFAVSWVFFIAGAAGAGAFGHPVPLLAELQGVLFFTGTITPALVALWLTARMEGGLGTQALLGRVLQWVVAGRWYVFAISYMALIKLAVALT